MKRFETVVYVAAHQFYLQDAEADWGGEYTNDPWGGGDGLGVAEGVVGVQTARAAGHAPVWVEVLEEAPGEPDAALDKVTTASITLRSGRLRVLGESNEESSPPLEIALASGTYEVRVLYVNLDTITYDDDDGAEHYLVQLHPGASRAAEIVRGFDPVDDPVRTTQRARSDIDSGLDSDDPSTQARALVDLARSGAVDAVTRIGSEHASRAMRVLAVNALRLVNARAALQSFAASDDPAVRGNVRRSLNRFED